MPMRLTRRRLDLDQTLPGASARPLPFDANVACLDGTCSRRCCVRVARGRSFAMTAYYDLGNYRRTVTTRSSDAQAWFDRGLVWCYGFNHEEAVRCFAKATEADPSCAMAWWGIAYA